MYFNAGYGLATLPSDDATWALIDCFSGAWQMPLHIRPIAGGAADAQSPYGYSGVYAHPRLTPEEIRIAWADALGALNSLGIVSIFLRRSPLVSQAELPHGHQPIVADHQTVLIDVDDVESMWRRLEGRCRTAVRKADKLGVTTDLRIARPSDLDSQSAFRTLYAETMRRRAAAAHYLFDETYYAQLLEALRGDLLIAETKNARGRTIASALLMKDSRMMHYHLSASSREALQCGAINQLLWHCCIAAGEYGVIGFHLGGGISGNDSLLKFKRSFGGRLMDYSAHGLVIDQKKYDALVTSRARALGMRGTDLANESYFPSYRAPVATN